MDGLKHLFTPKWHTILDPVVWLEAGTQIFFSLGLAFGGLIAFSSYNPVNNNCYRDAVMVSLTNCLTSMFAGIVVFSVIGFKATMVYDKCVNARNSSLNELLGGADYESFKLPDEGGLFNYTMENGTIRSIMIPYLPVCDLQKELDDVSNLYFLKDLFLIFSLVSVSFWNGIGVHYIHGSHKSVSWSAILVGSFLFDAFYTGNRFAVWNIGRSGYFHSRHEVISGFA